MAVFTVHGPPLRPADPVSDPDRMVFVRDGFSFWAFLLAPLWMLWHRMWLVLVAYLVLAGGLLAVLLRLGASQAAIVTAGLLLSLLLGLEASTLRRFTLCRRGFKEVGVISGNDREVAERRFFEAWRRDRAVKPDAGGGAAAMPPPARPPRTPPVVGLFPEPGGQG